MALPEDPALRIVTDAQFDGHAHAWADVTGKPTAYPPSGHAGSHGIGGSDRITPASIGAVPADDPRLFNSGVRRIAGMVNTPATGGSSSHLARSGPMVTLFLEWTTTAPWTSGAPLLTLPVGFRPPSSIYLPPGYDNLTGRLLMTYTGTLNWYGGASPNTFRAIYVWYTTDAPPTILPGTPG